ncbi:MAG TPA: hypothetical protein VFU92_00510 [Usitatibacter sp.]|nr:hypothetical protein [Usitatibacter sp.]
MTAASVELGVIGFMNAAFGLRFAPDFFFAGARLAAAFFTLRAGAFLAAGFFAAFLPFLAAIDESSNLMCWVLVHPALWRDSERMQSENHVVNNFHSEERVFSL